MAGIATRVEGSVAAEHRASWLLRCQQSLKGMGKWAVSGLGSLGRLLGSHAGGAFGILTYHRVASIPDRCPAPTWNVPPERFQEQLKGLLARGYHAWPLRTVLDFNRAGRAIPPRTFVVTFDDGYENNYSRAWPVLRELGIPATIFLATAYLNTAAPFPFDDWPAAGSPDVSADSWRPLTTGQCNEMLAHGLIDLGCHSHRHSLFRGRPEALVEDIVESVEVLRERFGLADATFAFPFGIAGSALTAAARRSGVLCALNTQALLVRPHSDPFTWGRFTAEETDTAAMLAAKLDGWYTLASDAWRRWGGSVAAEEEASVNSVVETIRF